MGAQNRYVRPIGTIAMVAGQRVTIDLPRDYDYEYIGLRINGQVSVTAAATSVRADAPCQLVQRCEIVADGKNTLYSAPFWKASKANFQHGYLTANGASAVTPPSGTAIAQYTVEGVGIIDFASLDCVHPKDSNFRSGGLNLFQLALTFGQFSDIFVGGTVVNGATPITVEVFAVQLMEIPDATGKVSTPNALRKVSFQEISAVSTNARSEVRLPAGNLIKSILIRTEGNVTAGEPSDTILNSVEVAAGVDVRFKLTGALLKAQMRADLGAVPTGYYLIDFTRKGSALRNLSELWNVTGAAEPKIYLDVTGSANGKVQVVIEEYILAGVGAAS